MERYRINIFFLIFFLSIQGFASPKSLTYQGRILKSDGTPLEYNNVSFIFQITDPAGTCILYQEQVTGYNMTNSGGVFDVPIGLGTIQYPVGGATSILDMFNNSSTFNCGSCTLNSGAYTCVDGSSTYAATSGDNRKLRVSFYDGSGWKIITPDNTIRSVPFAGYALSAEKLGSNLASDFLLKAGLPTCSAGTFLSYNGTAFVCAPVSGASGGTVTNITSANSYLSILNNTSTPTLTVNVGTIANTVAAGNDPRIVNALQSGTSASGDLSGIYPGPTVKALQGVGVSATVPTAGQFLVYDGTTQYAPVSMGGDATMTSTGAVTIASSAVSNSKMANMAAGTLKGNITGGPAVPVDVTIVSLQGTTSSTFAAGNDSRITGALQASGGTMTGMLTLATGSTTLSPLRLPSGTLVTTPVSGNMESDGANLYWTDSTPTRQKLAHYSGTPANGQVLIGNGTGLSLATLTAGSGASITNSAGGITISATGTGISALTGDVTASGTGTVAATVASVGGSTAANVHTAEVTVNTNATNASTANTLVKRDSSGTANFKSVKLDGSTSGTLTETIPAAVTSYSITWPSAVAGTANSVLASDTSGNLSWINLGSVAGTINLTSQVTGVLPIANGGTNSATALTNNQLMYSNAGAIKELGAMTDGQIVVGKSAASPQIVNVTGDLAITNTGTTTIGKINGTAVTGVGLANNNLLQNTSGSAITANNLLVSNGTATGVTSLSTPVSGILTSTGGSVPTWSSISSDTFTQYALLTGRSGGQTLYGGTAASNNLTLDSTLNATKGNVLINPSGGNVGVGTTTPAAKLDVAGSVKFAMDTTACSVTNGGAQRYNSGNMEYCNGIAWIAYAASGAGITDFNGLTASTQTFGVPGTSGTAPTWSSSGSTHTLNIPMASGASVTAGLISKTDYDNFNSKLGISSALTGDVSGTFSTTSVDKIKGKAVSTTAPTSAQFLVYDGTTQYAPVSMSGDATMTNTGAVTIASSAVSNSKMANMAAGTLKGNTTGAAASPTDITIASLQGTTPSTFAAGNDSRITGALQASGGTMTGMLTLATGSTTLSPLRLPSGTLVTTPVSGNMESDGANLYWTDNTPTRQKLAYYTGTPSNGQLLIGNGSEFSLATLTAGSGATITNSAGGITISATGTGISALTGDVTASGTGSVAATVASVGGSTAANVHTAEVTVNTNATNASTANTLVKRDSSGTASFKSVKLDGTTSGTLTQTVPATVTSYTVTWPSTLAGTANSVLASDTSGNLSWINLGSVAGTINLTSQVTGVLPIANGGTNSSTSLTNNQLMYSNAGAVKELGALTDGQIVVGKTAAAPQIVPVTGDLTITNTGTTTVGKINGTAVTGVGLANNNLLQNTSGSAITANNLLVSNGTATGVTSLSTPVSGILTSTGGSVPTWSSISSDTFTQYALLTGRSGGQTLNGGAAASNNLTLDSTLNATKGNVLINPSGGNIGIGTTNPNNSLVVMANSGTDPINSSVGTNGITVNTYENATGSVGSNFRNFSARGTFSSPAALLSGDTLGSWNSSGYWTGKTNAQFVSGDSRANITMIATENWSSSAHNGSAITFTTTTNGSPSSGERMRIDNTGNVGIGTGLPSSKLEIYETSNIGSILNISTPGTGTNQQSYLGLVTKADGSTLGTATNKGWFVGARGNSFGSAILQNDFDLSYWNGAAWTDVFSADSITGYVGIGTTVPNSVLTVDGGAGVLSLRAGPSLDHVYLQLFARSATPNTRSGYLGYPGAGSNDIRLFNEISGGNISLMTTGTGAVGIGTTGPSGKLHIQGDNGYGMSLVLTPTNTGNHVVLVPPANDGSVAFGVTNTTNTAWEAYMLNNGTVGYVSLANLSDKRLKKDIKPLGQGVEEILKLNSVEYHWINKDFSQERQIGFIAQEVEKIFPELVSEGPDGYKRVNYVGIIPVLVNAIKEISAKISNLIIKSDSHSRSIASLQSDNQENKSSLQLLKAENAQIKAENTQLKNENALIKSYLCSKDPSATICL